MENYKLIKLREHPEFLDYGAEWFHQKWNIPLEAYLESMEACFKNEGGVPQWYMAVMENKIIG